MNNFQLPVTSPSPNVNAPAEISIAQESNQERDGDVGNDLGGQEERDNHVGFDLGGPEEREDPNPSFPASVNDLPRALRAKGLLAEKMLEYLKKGYSFPVKDFKVLLRFYRDKAIHRKLFSFLENQMSKAL